MDSQLNVGPRLSFSDVINVCRGATENRGNVSVRNSHGDHRLDFDDVGFGKFGVWVTASFGVRVQHMHRVRSISRAVDVLKILKTVVLLVAVLVIDLQIGLADKSLHYKAMHKNSFLISVSR